MDPYDYEPEESSPWVFAAIGLAVILFVVSFGMAVGAIIALAIR